MRALVLRKSKFSETDLVIQFLTETGEVLAAFAAGAQRSKRRFPHHFEWSGLYEIDLQPSRGSGLNRLKACDLVSFDPALAKTWDVFQRWAVLCEWIGYESQQVWNFEEILSLLRRLPQSGGQEAFLRFFIREIESHGLSPDFERCGRCRFMLDSEQPLRFHLESAEFRHLTCAASRDSLIPPSAREFWQTPREETVLDLASAESLETILVPFLEFHLQRPLKAQRARGLGALARPVDRAREGDLHQSLPDAI